MLSLGYLKTDELIRRLVSGVNYNRGLCKKVLAKSSAVVL
jgi:hypothetical protein